MPELSVRKFAETLGTNHTTINTLIKKLEAETSATIGRSTGKGKARFLSEPEQALLRTRLATGKVAQELESQTTAIVYQTQVMNPVEPLEIQPVTVFQLDTSLVDADTFRNQQALLTLKEQLRSKVMGEATAFVGELQAEIKQVVTRGVAEAYQQVL
jgi:plasmid maintenance system antidote protein VapI